MSRITMRDIAKLLGVNPSTVSRALKDHPDIGEEMSNKIKQVARDLGYQPNYQAINFRQRKSKLVGLILPEMGRFFFPDMVKAIEEIVKKKGYNLIILQSNDILEKEKECIDLCLNFGIEGLLACLTKETQNLEHLNSLYQNNIPTVLVDKVVQERKSATVVINDFAAAYTAIHYLAGKKYQKIAGVFGNKNLAITQQRKAGFQAALKKHQLDSCEEYCFYANSVLDAKEKFYKLLQQDNKPKAVFTMSDELLVAIIQVIYEEKLRIPQDIAVISISNGYLPYYINPKITYIRHSGYEVGQAAANLLADLIEHSNKVSEKQIELATYLVELDSC